MATLSRPTATPAPTDDGWPRMTPEALRKLHVWLRAVKWCHGCQASLPIQRFYLSPTTGYARNATATTREVSGSGPRSPDE